MGKELWKGNEAIAEAAIRAGCKYFFGYPITPQSEVPEYLAKHLPLVGGCFLQSESELAAISMVYGAAGAGARVMTSSSSVGISLKQEGITYLAGSQLPCVIVNMMRGGPGLGSILPSQADYFQATRGGGNGDYRTPVFAPATIQEAVDLTQEAFDVADYYRNPVMILADGMIGQMMESVEWHEVPHRELPPKTWATTGTHDEREHNIIHSAIIAADDAFEVSEMVRKKCEEMARNEVRYETLDTEGAEVLFVAYGTASRLAHAAMLQLEKKGIRAGLFRPITLWPYPYAELKKVAMQESVKAVVVAEMSLGQMIDDVRIALEGVKPISFVGVGGGATFTPAMIADKAVSALGGKD